MLTLVLSIALCGTAFAARKKFTGFSLDIPAGWESTEHTDDKGVKTAVLTNAAKKVTPMIGVDALGGKTIQQKAEELAKLVGVAAEDLGDGAFGAKVTSPQGDAFMDGYGLGRTRLPENSHDQPRIFRTTENLE